MGIRLKRRFKAVLKVEQIRFLRRAWNRARNLWTTNLTQLALIHGTDKWNSHWYTPHYDHHLRPLRRKKLNILEIGIGGNEYPEQGGESLRMWKRYFSRSSIYGIDIYDKSSHDEKRIKTFRGSQADPNFLKEVTKQIGRLDIIIDDGSHRIEHVIESFKILFPLLDDNGIYVIEDLETSYWRNYRGENDYFNNPQTSMGLLKSLVDGLNYMEYSKPGYVPTYFDKHIISVHFYHNLAFIYKGINNEESKKPVEETKRALVSRSR